MKIVHIAECAGGVDRYLEMLLPRLNDAYEQVFICSRNYDASKYRDMVSRVEQIDMTQNFSLVTIVKQVRQIRSLLKKHRPDIVYCHSSIAGGIGRMAALGMKCKVVYNPHGWAFNMKGSQASAFRAIEKLLARMTDRIVCISKAEYMAAGKNFVATRTDAIPTIVDEGEDGLLVGVDAPQEVADMVWFYYTHPETAQRMRETAREKAARRFDISRVALQHKEMLGTLKPIWLR